MQNNGRDNFKILLGSFVTVLGFGMISTWLRPYIGTEMLVGAFGASTAILFHSPQESLSRYQNLAGGYVLSCLVGTGLNYAFGPDQVVLKVALAVSLAIFLMRTFKLFHPAGGALALLCASYAFKQPSELLSYFLCTSVIGPSLFYFIVLIVRKSIYLDSHETDFKN